MRNSVETNAKRAQWKDIVATYQEPSLARAAWQMINTFGSYAALWWLIYLSLPISWWLVVPLAILAGGFVVRIFIIFHDCGHGSYFKSRRANDIVGFIAGVLTFTPYYHWRWEHNVHHATSGHLDKRGVGDIWTMTVQEYLEASRWKRFAYRLARNPFVLFVIAPLYLFLLRQRFPSTNANERERMSVWWMNLAIVVLAGALSFVFGLKDYLLIQLIITGVAGSAGVWLFYVQHQFEDVYWDRAKRIRSDNLHIMANGFPAGRPARIVSTPFSRQKSHDFSCITLRLPVGLPAIARQK